MDERNKYYGSQWRRDATGNPGGFLVDSSVHFIAALRLLAAGCNAGPAVSASAFTRHAKPDLPAPDSIAGIVRFESGVPASVSISLAASQMRWSLQVLWMPRYYFECKNNGQASIF